VRKQIVPVLRWLYIKFPVPIAIKERIKSVVLGRLPFVRRAFFGGPKTRWFYKESEAKALSHLRTLPEGDVWILIAEQRIPTPDRSSSSTRLYAILSILLDLGFKITFFSASEKNQYKWILDNKKAVEPYEAELTRKGISVFYGVDDALNHLMEEGYKYKYAFLSYPQPTFQFSPLIRAYAINAEVLYDTVDLHWLRLEREAEYKNNKTLLKKAERYYKMDRINIECSDRVIAITEDEKEQILSIAPDKKVEIISNIHAASPPGTSLADRKDLLFIGHYPHSPNEDAVIYFVKEVLPIIHKTIPGVNFTMLGNGITKNVKALAGQYVKAVGYEEDPTPYFNSSRVFVAPLNFGGGMKGKIGQSMSLGLPVVTTKIGAEGMKLVHEENALIANSPESFADEVIRLYKNDTLWNKLSDEGLNHIEKNFSYNSLRPVIKKIFSPNGEEKQESQNDCHINSKQ